MDKHNIVFTEFGPHSVVRVLPVHDNSITVELPFLFIRGHDETIQLSAEALSWARSRLLDANLSTIERGIRTLANFNDYCVEFIKDRTVDEDDIDYVAYCYLCFRYNGLPQQNGSLSRRWRPASPDTVRAELRDLSAFFKYSAKNFGFVSLGGKNYHQSGDSLPVKRLYEMKGRAAWDLLIHLDQHRAFWERLSAPEDPLIAPVFRRARRAGSNATRTVMPDDEVWEIIARERNPVFRGFWLVGGFAGPRLSEQLNFWQIDILPGSFRNPLFGYHYPDKPLVLKAHPIESTYSGSLSKAGPTRRQHLIDASLGRLKPRPEYRRGHPMRAGWKGVVFTNAQLKLSEAFWINEEAARLFAECAKEIQDFHRFNRTSRKHPYFYVNLTDTTQDFRGDPLRVSNLQHHWEAACRRCGLKPRTQGRNVHGLRHFYKHTAEVLGIPKDLIQIMLGHASIDSQDDYGQSAREVNVTLMRELCRERVSSS